MNRPKLYIGNNRLDFDDHFNVRFQVYDFQDLNIGNNNKSYPLTIPLSRDNIKLLGFPNLLSSKIDISEDARLDLGGITIIKGILQVLDVDAQNLRAVINADDWVNEIAGIKLPNLSWVAGDNHEFNVTNVVNSWTAAAGAFYRYPLLNLGELYSEETGADAKVYPVDFPVMFNVGDIIERIFAQSGYELDSGHFFNSTEGAKIYLLSTEDPATEDYIINKGLEVYVNDDTDNRASITHSSGGTVDTVTLTKNPMAVELDSTDEAGAYAANVYTVPEDGTYRFTAQLQMQCTHNDVAAFVALAQSLEWQIRKNGTMIEEVDEASVIDPHLFADGNQFTLDTGWIHLEAGDEIDMYLNAFSRATNTGSSRIVYLNTISDVTWIKLVWDTRCRFKGIGKTITPAAFLPDIESVDFLRGLKQMYNLRFWVDRLNKKVYIYTANDFVGTTVKDWTERVDTNNDPVSLALSTNYAKTQRLRYAADSSDKAYTNYVSNNGIPLSKDVVLSNTSVKAGVDENTNPVFAPTIAAAMPQIGHTGSGVPRIFGGEDFMGGGKAYPQYRPTEWEPRILKWNGMQSLGTGSFNLHDDPEDYSATNYTTYPQAECPDFDDLYDSYYQRTFHMIDGGRMLRVEVWLKPKDINEFFTVLGTAANEGFRALYKLRINGQEMLYILTKITTDGVRAKCEFIQKL